MVGTAIEFVGQPGIAFGIRSEEAIFGEKPGIVVIGGQTATVIKWSEKDIRGLVARESKPGKWSVTTAEGETFTGEYVG